MRFISITDIDEQIRDPLQLMLKGKPEVIKLETQESGIVIGDSHGWVYAFPIKFLLEGNYYPFDFYQAHDNPVKALDMITGKED